MKQRLSRQYYRPALQYALAKTKPTLELSIMRQRDLGMAHYLLDRHADKWDTMALGRAMMWAAVAAPGNPAGWLTVIEKIASHGKAGELCPSMVQQSILQAAQQHDVAMARFLFTLPQVSGIGQQGWNDILMDTLPQGHPYKKVIEKRGFTDVDGNPEIQKMVEAAMAAQKAGRKAAKPGIKPS